MQGSDTIRLSVPAQKQMLLVVRMTTAGVLARMGLTVDKLEDMKMAVEEAVGYLFRQEGCRQVELEYAAENGEIVITANALQGVCPCDAKTDAVMRCILSSMADDVSMREEDGGIRSITLRKHLGR